LEKKINTKNIINGSSNLPLDSTLSDIVIQDGSFIFTGVLQLVYKKV